ncbi:LamG domain-containing protein [Glaciecola siphonariae]|uniref:LamG domain-containing protein n=1 Tax=Glaciecola siphonariae TaxID=521012 RepID=A0ABV9LSK1_9ALTE
MSKTKMGKTKYRCLFGLLLTTVGFISVAAGDTEPKSQAALTDNTLPNNTLPINTSPNKKGLLFYASFDEHPDADIAMGDAKVYTAQSMSKRFDLRSGIESKNIEQQTHGGVFGGALVFSEHASEFLVFKGDSNLPSSDDIFSVTVSLWLKTSPLKQLPNEYVDPIMILDDAWNDGSIFVDFDKSETKDFRLGVFSEYVFWNPMDIDFNDFPISERPMVGVKSDIFASHEWTHVALTINDINANSPSVAKLYINGELQNSFKRPLKIAWNPANLRIVLGLNYVGAIDELAIFDRPLAHNEIAQLYLHSPLMPLP